MTKNSDAEAIRSMFAGDDPAADVKPGYLPLAVAEQITRQPGLTARRKRATGVPHRNHGAARWGHRAVRPYRTRLVAAGAALTAIAVVAGLTAGFDVFSTGQHHVPTLPGPESRPNVATNPLSRGRPGMPQLLAFHADAGASSERAVLAALAAGAARLRGLRHGHYFYVRTRSWTIGTVVAGKKPCTVFIAGESQQWIARDGSGRRAGRTTSLNPPNACGTGQKPGSSNEYFGRGKLALMYRETLSSDPAVLRRQLNVGHPVSDGAAEFLTAVNDLYLEQPVRPAVAAAIVKLVSQEPGIHYDGTTTDRAGRPGIGYSIESGYSGLPTQYLVVFDAKTGQLLDSEEILNKTAGALNIPVPSVIGYDLYLKSGVTNHD